MTNSYENALTAEQEQYGELAAKLGKRLEALNWDAAEASLVSEMNLLDAPIEAAQADFSTAAKDDNHFWVRLAELSYWAYDTDQRFKTKYQNLHPASIEIGDLRVVLIATAQKQLLVSFRGSDNLKNWLRDAHICQTQVKAFGGAWLHRGFYNAYTKLRSALRNKVAAMYNSGLANSTYVCGHSLGGAMANICALDFLVDPPHGNFKFETLVTFGEPRVGDDIFASLSNQKVPAASFRRYTNAGDFVTWIPLRWMKLSVCRERSTLWYKHPDTRIKIKWQAKGSLAEELTDEDDDEVWAMEEMLRLLELSDAELQEELLGGTKAKNAGKRGHSMQWYWDILQQLAEA